MRTALLALICLVPALAGAQPLGTFRWRTEPYCNVVTVTVTQTDGVYTLDGFDEQCGGNPRQPVHGIAVLQANGSITLGFDVVTLLGATPVSIEAGISPSSLSGIWRDSAGNSGDFAFNPASTGGAGPRPGPVPPAPIPSSFVLQPQGGFAAIGDTNQPSAIPATGPGRRMMWHQAKAAFRSGEAFGAEWDDNSVGVASSAFGAGVLASGPASFAAGSSLAAHGASSVALGSFAVTPAFAEGAFVFGDRSTVSNLTAPGANVFWVRAAGGTRFFSNPSMSTGVSLAPNGGSWVSLSDVNQKELFEDLDGEDVLGKLARMPVREWSYKAQGGTIRHVGPTAQDFRAAFGLGDDPLGINTIDADGIALRAIQALEARTHEYEARIKALEQQIAEMAAAAGSRR